MEKVEDFLKEGQVVQVKVLETDETGRIKLSMKALIERPEGMAEERYEPRGDRGDRGPRRDREDRPRRDREDRPRREHAPAAEGGEGQQAAAPAAPAADKPAE